MIIEQDTDMESVLTSREGTEANTSETTNATGVKSSNFTRYECTRTTNPSSTTAFYLTRGFDISKFFSMLFLCNLGIVFSIHGLFYWKKEDNFWFYVDRIIHF